MFHSTPGIENNSDPCSRLPTKRFQRFIYTVDRDGWNYQTHVYNFFHRVKVFIKGNESGETKDFYH